MIMLGISPLVLELPICTMHWVAGSKRLTPVEACTVSCLTEIPHIQNLWGRASLGKQGAFARTPTLQPIFNRVDHLGMPRLSTDYTGAVQRKEGGSFELRDSICDHSVSNPW